uniref:Uncharacterized protein n=1 Tax=Clytia hemisphaerica TaxID=252671 RepID=A0A7M5V8T4_9CNID
MMKFMGRTLCVENRDYNVNDTERIYFFDTQEHRSGTQRCSSTCTDMFETSTGTTRGVPQNENGVLWAGYERIKKCGDDGGCVWADSKYLKFVNTKISGTSNLKICNAIDGLDGEPFAKSITVNVYHCQNSIYPRQETCDKEPIRRNLYLPIDKPVNLNYEINDYDIQAFFNGQTLCVGLREYYVNRTAYACRRECEAFFVKREPEDEIGITWASYERMDKCVYSRCSSYSSTKYLKFVNVTNPPSPTNHANIIEANTHFITLWLLTGLMIKVLID